MAEIPNHIKQAVTDYVAGLCNEIPVKSAVLFGSYATGKWNQESDIDIAIFSEYFAAMNRVDAITLLLQKAWPYHLDIQPLAFDAQDLANEAENPFIHEIVTTGMKIV